MRRPDPSPPEIRAVVADRLEFLLGRPDRSRRSTQRDTRTEADELEDGPVLGSPSAVSRAFTRAHVTVVTVLVLLGLLGAGWALFRARPVAVAAPGAAGVALTTTAPGPGPGSAAATPARPPIVVHVVGAVRRPGLVRLPDGARVQDAIDAAGGLTGAARPGRLNLAQLLGDGQQLVVGTNRDPVSEVRDQAGSVGSTAGPSTGPRSGALLDLNRATESDLDQLPGIGPVTAAAIVAWRTQHGRFSSVAELQQVDGIGPKTYADIAPRVRV